jgi:hypothetical protein
MGDSAPRYRVPDGVIDRAIGGELLVHRFDTDQVFVLNEDARRVFEAVRDAGSHEDVLAGVSREVLATRSRSASSRARLGEMRLQGLIELDERSERSPTE